MKVHPCTTTKKMDKKNPFMYRIARTCAEQQKDVT